MKRVLNPRDVTDQLERFGMVVRDNEFFKASEEKLKDFIIKEPKKAKKAKVSDEDQDKKDNSEVEYIYVHNTRKKYLEAP